MRERRFKKLSLRRPAILFALVILFIVGLTVLWNIVLVHDYNLLKELAVDQVFHWTFIVVGSAVFLAIIVLSTVLAIQLFANLRWRQQQSNFIASVSHELNSPLTSIKLFAQTLRREDLSAGSRQSFVGKILMDADRLSHLVANILRVAEVDSRGEELAVAPGEVDFRAYLSDYLEDARTVHAGKIDLSLTGAEACVEIDPIMFRQVLDNLIDNAIRYRGEGPAQVELSIVRDGEWTELHVADHGIGIPEESLENIFERFYRIEGGGPETGRRGVGIGLNVVRSIVRSHGGSVEARSEGAGRGTVISIRLPAVPRAVVEA